MKTIPPISSSWPFLFLVIVWLCTWCCTPYVSSQCLDDQRSLLLQFKNNLTFGSITLEESMGWNQSTDCCQWSGITCDHSTGRVIGLAVMNTKITGSINNSCSLFHLQFLKSLNLQYNHNLQGEILSAIGNLQSLEELNLQYANFSGVIPSSISNLKKLRSIYLSKNHFSGVIPSSISNLKKLRSIYLSKNHFSGVIPSSISNLKKLRIIDLSNNTFSGPIPSFSSMKNLEYLDLSHNNLNGSINATEWDKLLSLEWLDLSYNSLDGSIPTSLFSLPLLKYIDLSGNKFSGQLNEFASIASSQLYSLVLSNNNLEGPIPNSIFELKNLSELDLSSNRLNGTLDLGNDILHSFKNLRYLDLSKNRLSITTNGGGENSSFPQLCILNLASCNLFTIPKFLKNQTSLQNLDLSMNHITGTMPGWMWQVPQLNLSFNHLEELEIPSTLSNYDCDEQLLHYFIDKYLDFSNNNFSSIDPNIGNHLSSTKAYYLSFSRNNFHGIIPTSLCNATNLEVLNLEYNNFGGIIPDCFTALTQLSTLNLRGNQLHGEIPAKFREGCSLETLELNENFLEGRIPRSLAHCKALKVLDLGNNQLNDTFPCHLNGLSNLQVLILHSNKLHGTIVCPQSHSIWPLLQIMDVSSNHFIGELKAQSLFNWPLMMAGVTKEQSEPSFIQTSFSGGAKYYQNSISLNFKGNSYQLQYILTIFTSIDFSNNAFHGELPEELGNLNALVVLNLSYNSFSGHIPSSLGNLSQIESLDLSWNNLSGKIPAQLANLNFLEYLDLSFNKLSGKIPTGPQLQTFKASSYEGNQGLYGPPLTAKDPTVTPPTSSEGSNWSSKSEQEWMLRGAEVGFPVGITVFVGPILYIKRYREWYCKHLHILIMKILRKEDNITRARRRRRRNQQRQRH
ncbi:receptor-like protein 12 isoform X2 [Chenopodium quinoa]|uniref:receptor-like protein 12 isoform X2 n=1 Tax=Chenopodium quinoa TaxID=63459 RepID=UPI000B787351|nr:receptor-like protein 12 isoform X2 [Chenopodium quinoa]